MNTTEYDFFGKLVAARHLTDFQALVVPYLRDRFQAQSVLLMRFEQDMKPEILFRWIPDPDLRQTFDKSYVDFGFLLDPFYLHSWKIDRSQCFLLRDIAPDRFESSRYYDSYFSATRMVDDMGLLSPLNQRAVLHLSLGRGRGQRRFSARDLKSFTQLSTVLVPKLFDMLDQPTRHIKAHSTPLEQRFQDRCQAMSKPVTAREAEVAAHIVQGHSSRSIGLNLGISMHTVKVHRRSLYRKLDIGSQQELFGILADIRDAP